MKPLSVLRKVLLPGALVVFSCGAHAEETENLESHSMEFSRDVPFWTCRAEARDDSGLFFLGMGRTQADAYVRALEACNRQNRSCIITCEPGGANW